MQKKVPRLQQIVQTLKSTDGTGTGTEQVLWYSITVQLQFVVSTSVYIRLILKTKAVTKTMTTQLFTVFLGQHYSADLLTGNYKKS